MRGFGTFLRELVPSGWLSNLLPSALPQSETAFDSPKQAIVLGTTNPQPAIWPIAKRKEVASIIPSRFLTRVKARKQAEIEADLAAARAKHDQVSETFRTKRDNLLPIEADVRKGLEDKFNPLIKAAETTVKKLEKELATLDLDGRYPLVDIAFLRELKENGSGQTLPIFALFDPETSVFLLKTTAYAKSETSSYNNSIAPSYAASLFDIAKLVEIGHAYLKEQGRLEKLRAEEAKKSSRSDERGWEREIRTQAREVFSTDVSISASFHGLLPSDLRRRIKSNEEKFDQWLIVAQAPNWVLRFSENAYPVGLSNTCRIAVIGKKGDDYWLVEETTTH